jgi:hypothetical protein
VGVLTSLHSTSFTLCVVHHVTLLPSTREWCCLTRGSPLWYLRLLLYTRLTRWLIVPLRPERVGRQGVTLCGARCADGVVVWGQRGRVSLTTPRRTKTGGLLGLGGAVVKVWQPAQAERYSSPSILACCFYEVVCERGKRCMRKLEKVKNNLIKSDSKNGVKLMSFNAIKIPPPAINHPTRPMVVAKPTPPKNVKSVAPKNAKPTQAKAAKPAAPKPPHVEQEEQPAATRTLRRDSVTAMLQLRAELKVDVQPPTMLDDAEMGHFKSVVNSRETSTWDLHSLTLAANLARLLAEMDVCVAVQKAHTPGSPERRLAVQTTTSLAASILAVTRSLGLNASTSGKATVEQKNRNLAQSQQRKLVESIDDDLLA